MRTGRLGLLPSLLLAALALEACGRPAPSGAAAPADGWQVARLPAGAWSGVAGAGAELVLVAGGDDRRLHLLEAGALLGGADLAPREVPLEVDGEAYLTGGEDFATRGYQLADLWALPVDLQGVAFQAPDHLYLADRAFRVVYAGRLLADAEGRWRGARLERVFIVPGGRRAGAGQSDWHDQGPGLAGLEAVQGQRRTEDLHVVEREGERAGTFRLVKMDRYGHPWGTLTVVLGAPGAADVGGIAWVKDHHLVVRGAAPGLLTPVPDRVSFVGTVEAGEATTAPVAEGAGPWTGLTRTPRGLLVLVAGGPRACLAWR